MSFQRLKALLPMKDDMDDMDFVFLPDKARSRILVDCSDCPHCVYTVGERSVGNYSNVYCNNAKKIIHDFPIPMESIPQRNRQPHVSIPEWCPLRMITITHIPLNTKDINFVRWIILELSGIGRYAAVRPLKRGLNLVLEGEITPDVKEILVECLI